MNNSKITIGSIQEQKIQDLSIIYNNSIQLNIKNGYSFTINLNSRIGQDLMEIIDNAKDSVYNTTLNNDVKAKMIQTFFITISTKDINNNTFYKQIQCSILNWLWDCIFNTLKPYIMFQSQLNEFYINQIMNTKDILVLQNMEFIFNKPLTIYVDDIIKHLKENTTITLNNETIQIPEFVKIALNTINQEIFIETNVKSIIDMQNVILSSSFLTYGNN